MSKMKKGQLNEMVEELQSSVNELEWMNRKKQERIVELITENDRLTLAYEPYTPPRPKVSFNDWCVSATVDLFPISDWKRLGWDNSWSYKQLVVGPIRVDIYLS